MMDRIDRALRRRRSYIRIDHPEARRLFIKVIDDDPRLAVYIDGFTFREWRRGFSRGATYNVTYKNLHIPIDHIFVITSEEHARLVMCRASENYLTSFAICAPDGVSIAKAYDDYLFHYRAFYPNVETHLGERLSVVGSSYKYAAFKIKMRLGKEELERMEAEVDREVLRISRILFVKGMLPETCAYVAHNYIAKTVVYQTTEDTPVKLAHRQSAYGALINHSCVCQGYAEAYKRLLDAAGVKCEVIMGRLHGHEEYHAWNAVSFDGKTYYHVDVTNDDFKDGFDHYYFCATDDVMEKNRTWFRAPHVKCTSDRDVAAVARAQLKSEREKFISRGADPTYF